jgi:hypothetical protein
MTPEIWGGCVLIGSMVLMLVSGWIPGFDDLVNGGNPPTGYYSNATRADRVRPGQLPSAIGVVEGPGSSWPIGIAYGAGHLGGWRWDTDEDLGPVEPVWRLVVGKDEVDGRFVLRGGRFVELAEDSS